MYLMATGVFTLLAVGVTLVIGHLCVAVKLAMYYWMIVPLVIAELLIGFTVAWQCLSRSRSRALPVGAAMAVGFYFAFAVLMIIPFALGAGLLGMLIPHLLVALLLVIVVGSFGVASHHVGDAAPRFAAKKSFKMELARFQQERRELLSSDPALAAKTDEVAEALRFASDTVPGAENADAKIFAALEKLHATGGSGDTSAVMSVLEELLALTSWRQTVMREMR